MEEQPPWRQRSLPLALLLTTVGPGLSVVLAMIMATQIRGTGVDLQRVEALNAATSGISATLSSFQSAVTSDGKGARSLLSCGPAARCCSPGFALLVHDSRNLILQRVVILGPPISFAVPGDEWRLLV